MISGTVKDKKTKETLPNANVVLLNKNGDIIAGTTTNTNGRYTILNDKDKTLKVSYTGYESFTFQTGPFDSPTKDLQINVDLNPVVYDLPEVEIVADKATTSTTGNTTADKLFKRPWLFWLILAVGVVWMIWYFRTH